MAAHGGTKSLVFVYIIRFVAFFCGCPDALRDFLHFTVAVVLYSLLYGARLVCYDGGRLSLSC